MRRMMDDFDEVNEQMSHLGEQERGQGRARNVTLLRVP